MKKLFNFIITILCFWTLLLATGCSPDLDQADEETPPAKEAVVAATPVAVTPQASPAQPLIAKPEEAKKEDYAPATHMNNLDQPNQSQSPQGTYAPATHIGESAKSVTVKVALLIPMSGDSAALGKSLLDAAVLAIYDKYNGLSSREITARVELLPKDTTDSIEGAEKAAQDAIQEGATLILGPLLSKQVGAVSSIAKHKNIPIITFSNNITVAGDGVFLFGFIPEQQVIRIVQYSLTHKILNIAALVPSNPYGAAIVKQLSTEARKNGTRIHPIEYYTEDLSALDTNVGRLARFLQDDPSSGKSLFIAEGSDKLKTLTNTLAANGITSTTVQFLGTGLWDDPEITKWSNVQSGWFASSPPEKYRAFEKHFTATYGYKPERRASLSYDAVALATTLALSYNGKNFTKEMIVDPVGFNGPANGIFRFHEDGTIERALSILMVTPAGFKTVDPAPETFNQ